MTEAGPSASTRVRQRIGLAVPRLSSSFHALVDSPRFVALFPRYLVLLHTVLRASVPLMRDAADRLASDGDGAPLAADLRAYLERHIPEEQAHDEWLLQDLELLGWDRQAVLGSTPSPHVAAAVGSQYYWIRHHHPVALLGYIAVLEGYPPRIEDVHRWMTRTSLPRAAFRTLEKHAVLDPGHNHELDVLLDGLPLDDRHLRSICVNGVATAASLGLALQDLLDAPIEEAPHAERPEPTALDREGTEHP